MNDIIKTPNESFIVKFDFGLILEEDLISFAVIGDEGELTISNSSSDTRIAEFLLSDGFIGDYELTITPTTATGEQEPICKTVQVVNVLPESQNEMKLKKGSQKIVGLVWDSGEDFADLQIKTCSVSMIDLSDDSDVTGFGILSHGVESVTNNPQPVSVEIGTDNLNQGIYLIKATITANNAADDGIEQTYELQHTVIVL